MAKSRNGLDIEVSKAADNYVIVRRPHLSHLAAMVNRDVLRRIRKQRDLN
jgi:hypothetical protein